MVLLRLLQFQQLPAEELRVTSRLVTLRHEMTLKGSLYFPAPEEKGGLYPDGKRRLKATGETKLREPVLLKRRKAVCRDSYVQHFR